MAQKFKQGQTVVWKSGQGEATGTVEAYLTEAKTIDGQKVDASEKDPRYLVKNDNTGNVTGHKPETLLAADQSDDGDRWHPGDRVTWNTAQGETVGKVVKKLMSRTSIKGHTVDASESEPQYLVESEKTGEQAAHNPEALSEA